MSVFSKNYSDLKPLAWVDDDHFVGTIDWRGITKACYGWSKGGSFFIYTIEDGHISRLGVVKRNVVLDDEPEWV